MKINLSSQDLLKVQALSDQKALNMEAADLYNGFLADHYNDISEEVLENQTSVKRLSLEEAYYSAFLDILSINPDDSELKKLEENNSFNNIRSLNPDMFLNNPYLKNIRPPLNQSGKWKYVTNEYEAYEAFVYDETKVDKENNYAEKTQLGYFPKKVTYLNLLENNEVWMSITPHEINTMAEPIKRAKGKVVMFGLGLGYFAYMVSNKEEVSSLTIVEKSESAINLFKEDILPQFDHPEKIHVYKGDAFSYAKNKMPSESFTYSFFDIYHSPEEGLQSYFKMKKLEEYSPSTTYDYWIEESILCLLRRYVLTLIEEQLDGLDEKDYQVSETDEDKTMNRLYKVLKDYPLNSIVDVYTLLKDETLKGLAKQIE